MRAVCGRASSATPPEYTPRPAAPPVARGGRACHGQTLAACGPHSARPASSRGCACPGRRTRSSRNPPRSHSCASRRSSTAACAAAIPAAAQARRRACGSASTCPRA
eukprot:scaffold20343_cov103-Isochrysis_galbana.AAC.10